MKKVLIGVLGLAGVLVLVAAGGLYWFKTQFDEASAKTVASRPAEFGDHSILFVGAHPDDEQLVAGLLVQARAEGAKTYMLTATRGEAGQQHPQIARQKDLGAVRMAETLVNSYALGVEAHDVLNYPDSGVITVPEEELIAAVQARMVLWKPDTLATFWPESGFSKHNDHMRMGKVAKIAAERLRAKPVDGYAGPKHIAYPLAPSKAMRLVGGERGKWVADHQPPAQYSIYSNPAVKLRGWEIHATQRDYVQADYGFPAWFVHRIWNSEHYYVETLK
ncbi:PIG-L deacetylase family protein [Rhodoferax saidenbachensis]|uniref:PIG-L family deacetylase n=1 Tax=Rhodoferax saidenbachensis TaxID=1484693 RepID=A0A1P8K792_9BURK|nr:PIG-L family deacetylase [Rhodoferax saidenbachensis]APW41854.1 PIG-L family deacetylase [Rhodoferax saidenbachensis]